MNTNTYTNTNPPSRQISPHRNSVKNENEHARARSYHTTDIHSQSIKSGNNIVTVSQQKQMPSGQYGGGTMQSTGKNNLSNTGIQIKKQ